MLNFTELEDNASCLSQADLLKEFEKQENTIESSSNSPVNK